LSGSAPPPQDRVRGLYCIIEATPSDVDAVQSIADSLLEGGANVIELRMPGASPRVIAETTQALIGRCHTRATLILSDRLDVALGLGTDGIHLGPDDIPTTVAKTLARQGFLIGRTATTSEGVRAARMAGVDYMLFEIAPRGTTADARAFADFLGICTWVDAPLFAVAAANEESIRQVARPGTAGAAVFFRTSDGPVAPERIRALSKAFQEEQSRGRRSPGNYPFA
jgi:thiamine-phosphate pyrophosphorylase